MAKSMKSSAAATMEKLKGLSLRQPWPEQILRGEKTEEFRQIPTKHRGTIYLYASLGRLDPDEEEQLSAEYGYDVKSLRRGVVVGTVEITDCEFQPDEGDYAWFLANPQRLDQPVAPIERPQPIWFHPFGKPD